MQLHKRIVFVEDNPVDHQFVKKAFEQTGMDLEIIHLKSGSELLEFIQTDNMDNIALVLLDLNIPGVNGLGLLKQFYKDEIFKRLPIVVLSASEEDADIQLCYELGANAYVRKSMDPEVYLKTIVDIANFWCSINVLPSLKNEIY